MLIAKSPMSATCRLSKGAAPVCKLYGRSIADSARTSFGPNRVPDRQDVPISIGMPKTATSNPAKSLADGRRMNVLGPENRARSLPLIGWFLSAIAQSPSQQAAKLCRDMCACDRGGPCSVKGGRNLDHIPAFDIDPGEVA